MSIEQTPPTPPTPLDAARNTIISMGSDRRAAQGLQEIREINLARIEFLEKKQASPVGLNFEEISELVGLRQKTKNINSPSNYLS